MNKLQINILVIFSKVPLNYYMLKKTNINIASVASKTTFLLKYLTIPDQYTGEIMHVLG